jgi:cytoskeleton protein RodZ
MSESVLNETRGGPSASAARLGAELRTVRQNLGWDLGDLARSLRIRQAYLEAIEAGRISDLPGTTYALGFVRAYASALGLQGEQVASRFRAESAEANIRPALSFPAPVPQRGVPAGALMLLGLVVLAGAYSGWYWVSERQHTPAQTVPPIPDQLEPAQEKPTPSPQVASLLPSASPPAPAQPKPVAAPPLAVPAVTPPVNSAAPVPLPTVQAPGRQAPAVQLPPAPAVVATAPAAAAPPAAASPPGTRIVVKATADAWVTVKPKGGAPVFNKLMHAGDTWPVPADTPGLLLTTGNAGGTEIDVDGTPVPGVGGSGMVRHDLPLDADLLKSGHVPPIVHGKPKPASDVDNG